MTAELSKYRVIEHLESINPEEYHLFLYNLLSRCENRFTTVNILLSEILRYEPSVSSSVSKVKRVITLLSNEDLYCDIHIFFSFSSHPPFSFTENKEAWIDFMWEKVRLESLRSMREICSLFSIPESQANECYVNKTVFHSGDVSSNYLLL